MKHVIYHTEYIDAEGRFLREEEYDAYFNTVPSDIQGLERTAFNGYRIFNPTHRKCNIGKEHLERLKSKKPDYELKYVSIFGAEEDQRAIYAIYEKMLPDDEYGVIYSAGVEIGEENNGVSFSLDVTPIDYDILYNEHVTRWDGIRCDGTGIFPTGDWISFLESPEDDKDKRVSVVHGNWSLHGKWEKIIHKNKFITEYHCRNSLFPFVIILNTAHTQEDWNELEKLTS